MQIIVVLRLKRRRQIPGRGHQYFIKTLRKYRSFSAAHATRNGNAAGCPMEFCLSFQRLPKF